MDVPKPSLPPIVPVLAQVPVAPFTAASSGKRFGNLVIDAVAVRIFEAIFISQILGQFEFNSFLASIIIYFVYYIGLESLNGKTLGKYITGTHVISRDGSDADFNQILIRTISRYVPFEPLSFLGGARPSGWHDKWSKTMVVDDKSSN